MFCDNLFQISSCYKTVTSSSLVYFNVMHFMHFTYINFTRVNSCLLYAVRSYTCYMGQPINAEHFKLLHCKKKSDHSIFDGTCLHELCAYCVNVGQDKFFI